MSGIKTPGESPDQQINVRVLFFGAARDVAGQNEIEFTLAGPIKAADAFVEVLSAYPELRRFGRSLLFAVNQEYAPTDREIREGDELALFPPVSGGSKADTGTRGPGDTETVETSEAEPGTAGMLAAATFGNDFFELTVQPIDVGTVARRVVLPECGASVTLDGYAREWTRGRRTLHLVYEAYQPMAISEMNRLGGEAHERFEIAHIGIVHRTGRLEIGETSVVIAVSAPHRGAAFEACEWAIRELKRTVPIWKKEVFEDGEVWVEGETAQVPPILQIINEIEERLRGDYREIELRGFLEEKLTVLRDYYRSDSRQFTKDQQEFLADVSTRLLPSIRLFIEMKDELLEVDSLEEFYFLKSKLKTILGDLEGVAVRLRVDKELKDLINRRHSIQEEDASNLRFRFTMRKEELNREAPLCDRGHKMEIRKGRFGFFWGCRTFPFCDSWKPLTYSQKDSLV